MDLSVLIFVALAVAWAVYLIPKALKQTDELARTRSVDSFSSRMRVFGLRPRQQPAPVTEAPVQPVQPRPLPTRAAVRRAAARRRTVLTVLVVLLTAVAGVASSGRIPWLSLAVPVLLIAGFLVIARVTVRRQRGVRRAVVPAPADVPAERMTAPVADSRPVAEGVEDTVGIRRAELAEAMNAPLADDGSLWDPLPMTLPTYVSKPRARRTVRTIEFSQSSGHDPIDSKLARDAEALRANAAPEPAGEDEQQRKAAGA